MRHLSYIYLLGLPDTPTQSEWLNKNLPNGSRIGVDPFLYSIDEWNRMEKELQSAGKLLSAVKPNLIDLIWQDRPARPQEPVHALGLEFAGKSAAEKLAEVREELEKAGAGFLVVSELDEIACKNKIFGLHVRVGL